MNYYFENVLKGFLPPQSKVVLEHTMRTNPKFVVIDVDLDDMPEIVFLIQQESTKQIGILKRNDMRWYLDELCSYEEGLNTGIYSILQPLEDIRLTEENVMDELTIQELFESGVNQFVSMIDGQLYYGTIEFEPIEMMPGDGEEPEDMGGEVIDFETGDLKGNGMRYNIYLIGDRLVKVNPNMITNLAIRIENPVTEEIQMINLPNNKGYSPYLFVGDFTGDGADDILVNFFVAPNGGYIYSYIYKMDGDKPKLIFDSRIFNENYQGLVKYMDEYKVQIEPLAIPKVYRVDLSMKDKDYLEELYDEDKNLKQDKEGNILGLVASNPVDYDANKIFNLSTIQTIIGKNYEDILALLETFLKWQPATKRFEPFIQYVSILGEGK